VVVAASGAFIGGCLPHSHIATILGLGTAALALGCLGLDGYLAKHGYYHPPTPDRYNGLKGLKLIYKDKTTDFIRRLRTVFGEKAFQKASFLILGEDEKSLRKIALMRARVAHLAQNCNKDLNSLQKIAARVFKETTGIDLAALKNVVSQEQWCAIGDFEKVVLVRIFPDEVVALTHKAMDDHFCIGVAEEIFLRECLNIPKFKGVFLQSTLGELRQTDALWCQVHEHYGNYLMCYRPSAEII